VVWKDPGDIAARDLRYGAGSAALQPRPPFTFVEEDTGGTQPKFMVRDAAGVLWNVKLGIEAQSETVSTRLVWAVGYFAEEAYYVPEAVIAGLARLKRGGDEVKPGGVVGGARFEPRRDGHQRVGEWEWDENPFVNTRELDGLKLLMMMLNNWDARDANNKVVRVTTETGMETRYLVSDLGATLGKAGGWPSHSKSDPEDFAESGFVEGVEDGIVKFDYSTRPTGLGTFALLYPPYFLSQRDVERGLKGVTVQHARWMGALLAQLTDGQLRQAFAAAHYDAADTDVYVGALRSRIHQLTALPAPIDTARGQRVP
jgi:hypothetical protein